VRELLNDLRTAPATLVRVVLVLHNSRNYMADDELVFIDEPNGHAFKAHRLYRYGVVASVIVLSAVMVGAIVHSVKGVAEHSA
jgi:hypothetical protein